MLRHAWDQPTYDTTLAVNIAGPIAVTQALLPHLADGALIIMVSSGEAKAAAVGQGRYVVLQTQHGKLHACAACRGAPEWPT